MKRRKETRLEHYLIERGYSLSYKTYVGKYKEKVDNFVYEKKVNDITYKISLDKFRYRIVSSAFYDKVEVFNSKTLEELEKINNDFQEERKWIVSKCLEEDNEENDLSTTREIEEHFFDEGDTNA